MYPTFITVLISAQKSLRDEVFTDDMLQEATNAGGVILTHPGSLFSFIRTPQFTRTDSQRSEEACATKITESGLA